ncbi:MAG: hypothetical protein LLG37_01030 [Spirochaetia bacterium]|nr:hypothetical protein [Spirochaetia bacterium]
MDFIRKSAATLSGAVRECLAESGLELDSVLLNLVGEKIFLNKREYTVECRQRPSRGPAPDAAVPQGHDISYARDILVKLLSLMRFSGASVSEKISDGLTVFEISTNGRDGLLIGKNGQNIIALQYLLTTVLDKQLRRHVPIVVDTGSYMKKRLSYLRSFCRGLCDRAKGPEGEAVTDYLPSYERKFIHEIVKSDPALKTFSVGRGSYKKVVISSTL